MVPSLHQRNRLAAMKRVQRAAVEAFRQRGFHAVTIEEVAASAGVAPVSVYRWFGSKEGLVLWDDYDPGLLAALAARVGGEPPLRAVRDAVVSELGGLYDPERDLVLSRTQLIHREPALLAATVHQTRALESAIVEVFADAGVGENDVERGVLASTAVAVLTRAVDVWQRDNARRPLAEIVHDAFAVLEDTRWMR